MRKVLVCLELKQVPYEIDPITPFFGDDRFTKLSPAAARARPDRRSRDSADSTVIAQYLDDRYPERYPLYPVGAAARARARWLEEYADTRMADVIIWGVFNKAVIEPGVWGRPRDLDGIARAMQDEVPGVLDYLETQSYRQRDSCSTPDASGIADISLASLFRNLGFARQRSRCRALATHRRVTSTGRLSQPAFTRLQRFEEAMMRTPIGQHREQTGGTRRAVDRRSAAGSAGHQRPGRGALHA